MLMVVELVIAVQLSGGGLLPTFAVPAGVVVVMAALQYLVQIREIRKHIDRDGRRIWWQDGQRTTVMLSQRLPDGGWSISGLVAHPRGSGGLVFAWADECMDTLDGTISLHAANSRLAAIYEAMGFEIVARPHWLTGAIPMRRHPAPAPRTYGSRSGPSP